MKKTLLASTAIVGGALIASSAATAAEVTSKDTYSVKLSGIARHSIGFHSADQGAATRGYGTAAPFSEVDVDANATADNGIRYGIRLEIRGPDSAQFDEAYIHMTSDSWGRVEMGAQDGAADRMNISGANATVGSGGISGGLGARQFWGNGVQTAFSNITRWDGLITASGDDAKVIYFTPRFSGFQLGASLTPNTGNSGRAPLTSVGVINDLYELGANYVGDFGDVGVTVAGTYQGGTEKGAAGAAAKEDHQVWSVGGTVAFAGFTIGAGYKMGPWGVSAAYQYGENDATATTKNKGTNIHLGGTYAVAPGWTAMLEYNHIEQEIEQATDGPSIDTVVFTNQFAF